MKSFSNFLSGFILISLVILTTSGCHKDIKCPNGVACTQGAQILYQGSDTGMVLSLIFPPNAVVTDAQLYFHDLTYSGVYTIPSRWFAKSYFDIEPSTLQLDQLVKIELGYLPADAIDDLGNNFEDNLQLYYIENSIYGKLWSIVNACQLDKVNHVVSAYVTKLGQYAVAAPKSLLVDEWWTTPGIGSYNYAKRMILYLDGSGVKYEVVDCDTTAATDWELSTKNFKWRVEQDSVLTLYAFHLTQICNGTSPADNPITQVFHVDDTYLHYDYTWERH
ncbi:MAG: hypothetical protein NTW49_09505 [Bacteroidia bacterium]|nr:hypothetical protein [Bacteroidia bacterium]